MKKIFVLLFLCFFISSGLMAQTRTRKVPFLPYAGITTDYRYVDGVSSTNSTGAAPRINSYKTIFFNEGSSEIRPDQQKKILQVGKWLEREGGSFYYVRIFTSPEVPSELARQRGGVVIEALSDFKVGKPILQYEHRKSPVINPNRVEVSP